MDVKVASKVGHALTRSLGGLSLAEGSMLLRLRRASIALLGLVGAVGLGLVFFISQIGWPGVISGPLPGTPTRVGTVHDAIALTHSGPSTAIAKPAAVSAGRGAGNPAHRGSSPSAGSQLGHSKQLQADTGVQPGHGTNQPTSSQPAPESAPVTPAPAPSTTPTVESSPPSASEAVKTSSSSKTSEAAVAKAVSDNSKSAAAAKSEGQKSTKDQGSSSSSTKSSEASSAKAKRDESVAKTKAKVPPPAAAPEKSAPPPSPAAAKEAADAAKANQAAH
jgi:ParB family transcriptional regulator, chromosome partitioning protein